MTRAIVWALNGVLIALCAFLTAGLIKAVAGHWLVGATPTEHAAASAPPEPPATWEDRQAILEKNLFNVSTLLPEAAPEDIAPPPDANLEETKLPLRLLGTLASTTPGDARAAVENQREGRKIVVVRVGDEILEGVRVVAVERRRIVIDNGGKREALSLDDETEQRISQQDPNAGRAIARASARAAPRPAPLPRARRIPEQAAAAPAQASRAPGAGDLGDPASIASQARFLPKYDEESQQLLGIEVTAIKPGSLLEEIGVQEGDVIIEFNGMDLENGEDSAALWRELADATSFEVQVIGKDGEPRLIEYSND